VDEGRARSRGVPVVSVDRGEHMPNCSRRGEAEGLYPDPPSAPDVVHRRRDRREWRTERRALGPAFRLGVALLFVTQLSASANGERSGRAEQAESGDQARANGGVAVLESLVVDGGLGGRRA
jgi:hypothetical protein